MTFTPSLVGEDAFTALFDQALAEAKEVVSPRMVKEYDWPEPEDFPEIDQPGHIGSEAFEDLDDAIALIEEEGAEQYAEAYQGPDGYWYVFYFDMT